MPLITWHQAKDTNDKLAADVSKLYADYVSANMLNVCHFILWGGKLLLHCLG